MDYFPRKSLSKYLIMDTIDFNKHVHDIDIFINDKWRKYAPELPSNVSPEVVLDTKIQNQF